MNVLQSTLQQEKKTRYSDNKRSSSHTTLQLPQKKNPKWSGSSTAVSDTVADTVSDDPLLEEPRKEEPRKGKSSKGKSSKGESRKEESRKGESHKGEALKSEATENPEWFKSGNWTAVPDDVPAAAVPDDVPAAAVPDDVPAAAVPDDVPATAVAATAAVADDVPAAAVPATNVRPMAIETMKASPEQALNDLALGKKYDVSPALVNTQREHFLQKSTADEAESTLRDAQKAAEWFVKSSHNAALIKDDLVNVNSLERLLQGKQDQALPKIDGTFIERTVQALREGSISTAIGVFGFALAGLENLRYLPSLYIENMIYKAFRGNDIADDLKDKIKERYEVLQEDPFTKASPAMQTWLDIVRQAPQMAIALLTIPMGGVILSSLLGGALAGGSKYAQLREEDVSEWRALGASVADGSINFLLGKANLGKIFDLAKSKGGQQIVRSFGEAALSDMTTSLGQTYIDKATTLWAMSPQTKQNPLLTFADNLGEYTKEGLYNGAISIPYTMAITGGKVAHDAVRYRRVLTQDAKFFENLDKNASESKLKQRSQEKYQELVDHIYADAPEQNLYLDPEKMRSALGDESTLYQTLDDLGMSKEEFARSESLGTDIEIPLNLYQGKIAGTERSLALREHIKTSPDGMTLSEQATFEKQFSKHVEETVDKFRDTLLQDDALNEALAPIQQELAQVYGEEGARSHVALLGARAIIAAESWSKAGKSMTPAEWITNEVKLRVSVENAGGKENALFQPSKQEISQADMALERDANAWAESIDIFLKGELKEREPVTMLEKTPLVLQMLGAEGIPIQTGQHILKKVMLDKHNLSADVVKQIPKAMADPIMIFESASQEGRIVMMLDIKDASGATVVVPIALEQKSSYTYAVHFVPSMYVKKSERGEVNNRWFINQIKKGNLRYIDQKKSQDWLRNSGIPEGTINLDKATLEQLRASQLQLLGGVTASGDKTIYMKQDLVKLRGENPTLYQGEEGVRGSISFHDNETLIRVFKDSADISTFVHETGHLFIKDMENILATGSAPEHIARDLQTLNEFTAEFSDPKKLQAFYESGYRNQRKEFSEREFSSLTEQEKEHVTYVAKQEKFADAFVEYLREGKAPSVALRPVFQRFKSWLQKIYQNLSGNAPINDSIREVFDRMLASEQEIALAEEVHNAHPEGRKNLERVAGDALTEREKKHLAKAQEQATTSSQEARLQKVLHAYSRAGINEKELHAKAKEEVEAKPVYVAQDKAMREGGLDYTTIKEIYGEETAKALQEKAPDLLSKEGTVPLHELAIAHNFASGEALIDAITKAQGKKSDIAALVKEKTLAQEQAIRKELLLDQGTNAADEDYFSSHRLETLELEARALTRHAGKKINSFGSAETLRALARRTLETLPYKEGRNIARLSAAEAKQAAQAEKALAAGEKETAADAKRKQAISHAMVLEAMKTRHETEAFTKALKGYTDSKTMNAEHQEQIRALSETYNLLPKANPLRPEKRLQPEKRLPFRKFVENISSKSVYEAPPFSDFLLHEQLPENMTLEQRQEVQGAIRWIAEEGQSQKATLISNKALGSVGEAVATGVKSIQKSGNAPKIQEKRSVQNAWQDFFSGLDHAPFMLMAADGYKDTGNTSQKKGFHSEWYQGVMHAQSKYSSLFKKAQPELLRIARVRDDFVKRFEAKYGRLAENVQGVATPEIMQKNGRTHWTAEQIWCLARNMGNAENVKTLHQGLGLSDPMLHQLTSILSKQEWLAIQSEGKLIGKHYESSDAVFRKVYGRSMPDKVEPLPRVVATAEGEMLPLQGWYFPRSVDGKLHADISDSKSLEANKSRFADISKNLEANKAEPRFADIGASKNIETSKAEPRFVAYGTALAKNVTNQSTAKAVALHYEVFDSALQDQWRFMTHAPVIHDIDRIMRNKEWQSAYTKAFGQEQYNQLRSWLKYTARPETGDVFDSAIDSQRKLLTVYSLGKNFSPFIGQFQGYSDIGKEWVRKGISRASHNPMEFVSYINKQSAFMAERDKNFERELRNSVVPIKAKRKIALGEKTYTHADIQECSMALASFGDRLTAYPLWQGAYRKATESLGMNHTKAVEFADGIVQKTQNSNTKADVTMGQRKSDKSGEKLFSLFMSEPLRKDPRMRSYWQAYEQKKMSTGEYISHLLYETVAPALLYVAATSLATSTQSEDMEGMAEQTFNEVGKALPFAGQIGRSLFSHQDSMRENPKSVEIAWGMKNGKKAAQGKEKAYADLFKSMVDLAAFSLETGDARSIYETAAESFENMKMGKTANPFSLFLKKPKK